MFIKKDTVYAEIGNYLKHNTLNMVGMSLKGSIKDFIELPLNNPLDLSRDDNFVYFQNGLFRWSPPEWDKDSIKTYLVKIRYSLDDQIALLLNKDVDKERMEAYNKMLEWRTFASKMADEILKL